MLDIALLAAERRGQRQWRGDQPRVLAGEEGSDEVAIRLGDDAHPISRDQTRAQKAFAELDRLVTQRAIGRDLEQLSALGVQVDAGHPLGGIVQRVGDGGEVGQPNGAMWVGGRWRHVRLFKLINDGRRKCAHVSGQSLGRLRATREACGRVTIPAQDP